MLRQITMIGLSALSITALSACASTPAGGPTGESSETFRTATSITPNLIEGGQAISFRVNRTIASAGGSDCRAIIGGAPPGAEIEISGRSARLNGMLVVTGDGFGQLVFEDPSGRLTCIAGMRPQGDAPRGGTPVGAFQTLLNRPFGTYRFWVAATTPGEFEVRLEYE